MYSDAIKYAEKFDAEHGDFVFVDGYLYFEDGAVRENNPMGVSILPPHDLLQRSKKIVYYWTIKLKLASEEFYLYKRKLIGATNVSLENPRYTTPPSLESIKTLQKLKVKAKAIKIKLEKAEADCESAIPEHIKAREKFAIENQHKASLVLTDIKNIEI